MEKRKIKFFPLFLLAIFAIFWVALLSGNILWTSDTTPLEIIDDMDNQQKVKAQTASAFFADGKAGREPLEHTVARTGTSTGTKYSTGLEEVDTKNINTVPVTPEVLARGKNRFETFCAPCHNYDGAGNGIVVQKGFAAPPSLVRPDAKAYSDGKLYHVISAGQNIMSSNADKLPELDRWCVVHYIRALQNGGTHPTMGTTVPQSTPATESGSRK